MSKHLMVPVLPYQLYETVGGINTSVPPATATVIVGTVQALTDAVVNAQENDVIEVLPGVYNLTNTLVPGAPNVTIQGSVATPVYTTIQGPGMDNAVYGNRPHGFWCQYPGLTLKNLTIRNFYQHGLTFGAGAGNILIDNCAFYDMGQQFIKASAFPNAIDNCTIRRTEFAFTSNRPTSNHDGQVFYGGFIDCHNSANWVVEDCTFREFTPTQAEISAAQSAYPGAMIYDWSPSIYFWNNSSNITVQRNKFINCGTAIAFGLMERGGGVHDCQGGIIRNNTFIMARELSPSQVSNSDAFIRLWDSPGTKVFHNTLIALPAGNSVGEAIRVRFTSTGTEVRNNLSNCTVRAMDGASITAANNKQDATTSLFVMGANNDLHLSTGSGLSVSRLPDCMDDMDSLPRATTTHQGADEFNG